MRYAYFYNIRVVNPINTNIFHFYQGVINLNIKIDNGDRFIEFVDLYVDSIKSEIEEKYHFNITRENITVKALSFLHEVEQ
ncbi:MAG: hypothetical protein FWB73_00290 [Treponema sp.]|nr:hypothetical protein [Treponema sp.]